MKLVKKNTLGCFHPRTIINKSLGEAITCACGKCDACVTSKADARTSFLNFVKEHSFLNVFVTLTYDDEHLPLSAYDNRGYDVPFTSDYEFYEVDRTYVAKETYRHTYYERTKLGFPDDKVLTYGTEVSGRCNLASLSPVDFNLLENGYTSTNGISLGSFLWPTLRKRDVQNFMKRFRKYFYIYEKANLYYFAVGEYGPQSLRPHYHAFMAFDSVCSYQQVVECIRRAWRFGTVKVMPVQSSAASYVAGYLNSSSRIPKFLDLKETRPFFLQSHYSTYALSDCEVAELKPIFDEARNRRVIEVPDGYDVCSLPKNVRSALFPKPPRFFAEDYHSLCELYKGFQRSYIVVPINEVDNEGRPYLSCYAKVALTALCHYCTTAVDHRLENLSIKIVDPYYYNAYLWTKKVARLAIAFDCLPSDVIRKIYDFHVLHDTRLSRFYMNCENDTSCFDVVCSLLSYNDVFSVLSHVKHISDLPARYRYQFELQNVISVLFDERGYLRFDVNELSSLNGFDNYRNEVLQRAHDKVKTKHLKDLYKPI